MNNKLNFIFNIVAILIDVGAAFLVIFTLSSAHIDDTQQKLDDAKARGECGQDNVMLKTYDGWLCVTIEQKSTRKQSNSL